MTYTNNMGTTVGASNWFTTANATTMSTYVQMYQATQSTTAMPSVYTNTCTAMPSVYTNTWAPPSGADYSLEDLERAIKARYGDMAMVIRRQHVHVQMPVHFSKPSELAGLLPMPEPQLAFVLKEKATYSLPDGSFLGLDEHGNYKVFDHEAKVIYKANRIREFNPYINASDLLEGFIKDVGAMGVRQSEFLNLPINAFIHWLIMKAAERDGDSLDGLPTVQQALPPPPPPPQKFLPRCGCCGRFIRKAWAQAQIAFCSPEHMGRQMLRLGAT